jgi:hypothetical protein
VGPFVLWSPREFVYGVFKWHNDPALYPGMKWQLGRDWAKQLCVAGIFWQYGAVALLKPLQMLVIGVLALRFWRRGAQRAELPTTLTCALALFIVLNPMVWGYLYWPAVVAGFVYSRPIAAGRSSSLRNS